MLHSMLLFTALLLPAAEPTAADPAATKLLAEARAARAAWANFPGFRADIEVNLDGQVSKGLLEVDAAGKVHLKGIDKDAETWAKYTLRSLINHRMSDAADRGT